MQSYVSAGYDLSKLIELAKLRYGTKAYEKVVQLEQLMTTHEGADEKTKLKAVNDFFNQQLTYTEDRLLWGQADYWATPLESIGKSAADCEDFSIAKYAFLRVLGIDNKKLRLTYVRAQLNNNGRISLQAHMVLSYFATPDSEPLILDNLTPEIKTASHRSDLYPVFSFNDQSLWVGKNRKPKSNSQNHLSKWRDVLTRMRNDGIE